MSKGGPAIVVAALLLAAAGCGISGASHPTCTLPSAPFGAPETVRLRVVDSGFTVVGPGPATLSMGAVVSNSGARVAYRTRVAFMPVDVKGQNPVAADERRPLVLDVPVILPGQEVAVGTSVPLGGPGPMDGPTGRVTRVAVTADATARLDATAFQPIQATLLSDRSNRAQDGSTTVDYEVHSGYCDDLYSRGASVVFRDDAGHVLGGDLINDTGGGCQTGTKLVQVQTAEKSVPQRADLNRTIVSTYCDVSRATPSGRTGAPAN